MTVLPKRSPVRAMVMMTRVTTMVRLLLWMLLLDVLLMVKWLVLMAEACRGGTMLPLLLLIGA